MSTRRESPLGPSPDGRDPQRNPSREPLHQPPNPADLRRAPPKTPICAQVRGWLRDFADNDLEASHCLVLEDHVHQCRHCAVELARAEHEVMQIRRAFAGIAIRTPMPVLPDDFPERVVDRLLVDDASVAASSATGLGGAGDAADGGVLDISAEVVQPAGATGARPGAKPADIVAVIERPAAARWLRLSPGGWLVATFSLLLLLALGIELFDSASREPERVARLVVVSANDAFNGDGLLGDGLGESQSLKVRAGGFARVNWHDLSSQPQPAATLELHGKGEVRLEGGAPVVANGRVVIEASRAVSIGMADGSRVELGEGEYVIAADLFSELEGALPVASDPMRWAPADLEITVEVVSGEPANIVRASVVGGTLIAAGNMGVYRGGGPISVGPRGGLAVQAAPQQGTRVAPSSDDRPSIFGNAVDSVGLPSVGAEVLVSFLAPSGPVAGAGATGASGTFAIDTQGGCRSGFAVVLALPPPARRELGIFAPDAVQLLRQGEGAQLMAPLVFGLASPLLCEVRDDLNQTRTGVQVMPCVVDELFGCVFPLDGERTVTDENGAFQLSRLPAHLPAHQRLVVLVSHNELEPVAVPIPTRGSAAANEPFGPIVVRRLRQVRLHLLPSISQIQVLEEIEGLPPGTAVWRRTAQSNWMGQVYSMSVGYGRMWVRTGTMVNPTVRELELDDLGPLPRYHPSGPHQPYASVFRTMHPLPDSHAEVVATYRHQRFDELVPATGAQTQHLRVLDSLVRPVAGAQVFAIGATGPRGSADVRFLGFTSALGAMPLQGVPSQGGVVAIGADGTIAVVPNPQAEPMHVVATLQATAHVSLHPALRPSPPRPVPIRFEKLGGPVAGMTPVAVRFACEANNWEVRDLPPGEYRATIVAAAGGQPFESTIDLTPGLVVVLQ